MIMDLARLHMVLVLKNSSDLFGILRVASNGVNYIRMRYLCYRHGTILNICTVVFKKKSIQSNSTP